LREWKQRFDPPEVSVQEYWIFRMSLDAGEQFCYRLLYNFGSVLARFKRIAICLLFV